MEEENFEIEEDRFTIGEVAKMFKMASSAIRFWEAEFEDLNPQKNEKGHRYYTREDVVLITKIHDLVKVKGYTIPAATSIP